MRRPPAPHLPGSCASSSRVGCGFAKSPDEERACFLYLLAGLISPPGHEAVRSARSRRMKPAQLLAEIFFDSSSLPLNAIFKPICEKRSLEEELECELDLPRRIGLSRDDTESSIRYTRVGAGKLRCIEGIKRLSPELQ